jgi:hypothetical protein
MYDGFDLIDPSTGKPWGPKEQQNWKDMADTVVKDTIQGQKDLEGHKHDRLYDSDGNVQIDANSSASPVEIAYGVNIPAGQNYMIDYVPIAGGGGDATGTIGFIPQFTGTTSLRDSSVHVGMHGLVINGSTDSGHQLQIRNPDDPSKLATFNIDTSGTLTIASSIGATLLDNAKAGLGFGYDENALSVNGCANIGADTTVSSASEKLRLSYDSANYTSFDVDTSGSLTIAPSGAGTITIDSSVAGSGIFLINRSKYSGQVSSIDLERGSINIASAAFDVNVNSFNFGAIDDIGQVRPFYMDSTSANGGTVRITGDGALSKTLELADSTVAITSYGNSQYYQTERHTLTVAGSTTNGLTYSGTPGPGMVITASESITIATTGTNTPVVISPQDNEGYNHNILFTSDSGGNVNITNAAGSAVTFLDSTATISCQLLTITSLPTSSSGLPSGALYNSSGTVKVV